MNNEFTLTDEQNKVRNAVPILKITLNGQNYLIYNIKRDEKNDNLFISQINNSNNDIITISDIVDKDIKSLINDTLKEMLEDVLVKGNVNSSKLPKNMVINTFNGQVESSNFTVIDAYLFTSTKENINKLINAISRLEEETNKTLKSNIPELDISKESNLQQALEVTTLFPEQIHPTANLKAPIDFPTAAPIPVSPAPINFETKITSMPKLETKPTSLEDEAQTTIKSQSQLSEQEEKGETINPSQEITFIDRTFNPDNNACDRINEDISTILSKPSKDIITLKNSLQQLYGQHTTEEIMPNLGKTKTHTLKKRGLPYPTSTTGYITTAAIVTIGLVSVGIASFLITLSIIQK